MKPLDYPLLADENIHPGVIEFLRNAGYDVEAIVAEGKFGLADSEVLQRASAAGRVILTHDSDFGGLAISRADFIGIIYLRPGHIRPEFTIQTLEAIRAHAPEVKPPFILVAERTGEIVRLRIRQL